jgi:hypothetical protein
LEANFSRLTASRKKPAALTATIARVSFGGLWRRARCREDESTYLTLAAANLIWLAVQRL